MKDPYLLTWKASTSSSPNRRSRRFRTLTT